MPTTRRVFFSPSLVLVLSLITILLISFSQANDGPLMIMGNPSAFSRKSQELFFGKVVNDMEPLPITETFPANHQNGMKILSTNSGDDFMTIESITYDVNNNIVYPPFDRSKLQDQDYVSYKITITDLATKSGASTGRGPVLAYANFAAPELPSNHEAYDMTKSDQPQYYPLECIEEGTTNSVTMRFITQGPQYSRVIFWPTAAGGDSFQDGEFVCILHFPLVDQYQYQSAFFGNLGNSYTRGYDYVITFYNTYPAHAPVHRVHFPVPTFKFQTKLTPLSDCQNEDCQLELEIQDYHGGEPILSTPWSFSMNPQDEFFCYLYDQTIPVFRILKTEADKIDFKLTRLGEEFLRVLFVPNTPLRCVFTIPWKTALLSDRRVGLFEYAGEKTYFNLPATRNDIIVHHQTCRVGASCNYTFEFTEAFIAQAPMLSLETSVGTIYNLIGEGEYCQITQLGQTVELQVIKRQKVTDTLSGENHRITCTLQFTPTPLVYPVTTINDFMSVGAHAVVEEPFSLHHLTVIPIRVFTPNITALQTIGGYADIDEYLATLQVMPQYFDKTLYQTYQHNTFKMPIGGTPTTYYEQDYYFYAPTTFVMSDAIRFVDTLFANSPAYSDQCMGLSYCPTTFKFSAGVFTVSKIRWPNHFRINTPLAKYPCWDENGQVVAELGLDSTMEFLDLLPVDQTRGFAWQSCWIDMPNFIIFPKTLSKVYYQLAFNAYYPHNTIHKPLYVIDEDPNNAYNNVFTDQMYFDAAAPLATFISNYFYQADTDGNYLTMGTSAQRRSFSGVEPPRTTLSTFTIEWMHFPATGLDAMGVPPIPDPAYIEPTVFRFSHATCNFLSMTQQDTTTALLNDEKSVPPTCTAVQNGPAMLKMSYQRDAQEHDEFVTQMTWKSYNNPPNVLKELVFYYSYPDPVTGRVVNNTLHVPLGSGMPVVNRPESKLYAPQQVPMVPALPSQTLDQTIHLFKGHVTRTYFTLTRTPVFSKLIFQLSYKPITSAKKIPLLWDVANIEDIQRDYPLVRIPADDLCDLCIVFQVTLNYAFLEPLGGQQNSFDTPNALLGIRLYDVPIDILYLDHYSSFGQQDKVSMDMISNHPLSTVWPRSTYPSILSKQVINTMYIAPFVPKFVTYGYSIHKPIFTKYGLSAGTALAGRVSNTGNGNNGYAAPIVVQLRPQQLFTDETYNPKWTYSFIGCDGWKYTNDTGLVESSGEWCEPTFGEEVLDSGRVVPRVDVSCHKWERGEFQNNIYRRDFGFIPMNMTMMAECRFITTLNLTFPQYAGNNTQSYVFENKFNFLPTAEEYGIHFFRDAMICDSEDIPVFVAGGPGVYYVQSPLAGTFTFVPKTTTQYQIETFTAANRATSSSNSASSASSSYRDLNVGMIKITVFEQQQQKTSTSAQYDSVGQLVGSTRSTQAVLSAATQTDIVPVLIYARIVCPDEGFNAIHQTVWSYTVNTLPTQTAKTLGGTTASVGAVNTAAGGSAGSLIRQGILSPTNGYYIYTPPTRMVLNQHFIIHMFANDDNEYRSEPGDTIGVKQVFYLQSSLSKEFKFQFATENTPQGLALFSPTVASDRVEYKYYTHGYVWDATAEKMVPTLLTKTTNATYRLHPNDHSKITFQLDDDIDLYDFNRWKLWGSDKSFDLTQYQDFGAVTSVIPYTHFSGNIIAASCYSTQPCVNIPKFALPITIVKYLRVSADFTPGLHTNRQTALSLSRTLTTGDIFRAVVWTNMNNVLSCDFKLKPLNRRFSTGLDYTLEIYTNLDGCSVIEIRPATDLQPWYKFNIPTQYDDLESVATGFDFTTFVNAQGEVVLKSQFEYFNINIDGTSTIQLPEVKWSDYKELQIPIQNFNFPRGFALSQRSTSTYDDPYAMMTNGGGSLTTDVEFVLGYDLLLGQKLYIGPLPLVPNQHQILIITLTADQDDGGSGAVTRHELEIATSEYYQNDKFNTTLTITSRTTTTIPMGTVLRITNLYVSVLEQYDMEYHHLGPYGGGHAIDVAYNNRFTIYAWSQGFGLGQHPLETFNIVQHSVAPWSNELMPLLDGTPQRTLQYVLDFVPQLDMIQQYNDHPLPCNVFDLCKMNINIFKTAQQTNTNNNNNQQGQQQQQQVTDNDYVVFNWERFDILIDFTKDGKTLLKTQEAFNIEDSTSISEILNSISYNIESNLTMYDVLNQTKIYPTNFGYNVQPIYNINGIILRFVKQSIAEQDATRTKAIGTINNIPFVLKFTTTQYTGSVQFSVIAYNTVANTAALVYSNEQIRGPVVIGEDENFQPYFYYTNGGLFIDELFEIGFAPSTTLSPRIDYNPEHPRPATVAIQYKYDEILDVNQNIPEIFKSYTGQKTKTQIIDRHYIAQRENISPLQYESGQTFVQISTQTNEMTMILKPGNTVSSLSETYVFQQQRPNTEEELQEAFIPTTPVDLTRGFDVMSFVEIFDTSLYNQYDPIPTQQGQQQENELPVSIINSLDSTYLIQDTRRRTNRVDGFKIRQRPWARVNTLVSVPGKGISNTIPLDYPAEVQVWFTINFDLPENYYFKNTDILLFSLPSFYKLSRTAWTCEHVCQHDDGTYPTGQPPMGCSSSFVYANHQMMLKFNQTITAGTAAAPTELICAFNVHVNSVDFYTALNAQGATAPYPEFMASTITYHTKELIIDGPGSAHLPTITSKNFFYPPITNPADYATRNTIEEDYLTYFPPMPIPYHKYDVELIDADYFGSDAKVRFKFHNTTLNSNIGQTAFISFPFNITLASSSSIDSNGNTINNNNNNGLNSITQTQCIDERTGLNVGTITMPQQICTHLPCILQLTLTNVPYPQNLFTCLSTIHIRSYNEQYKHAFNTQQIVIELGGNGGTNQQQNTASVSTYATMSFTTSFLDRHNRLTIRQPTPTVTLSGYVVENMVTQVTFTGTETTIHPGDVVTISLPFYFQSPHYDIGDIQCIAPGGEIVAQVVLQYQLNNFITYRDIVNLIEKGNTTEILTLLVPYLNVPESAIQNNTFVNWIQHNVLDVAIKDQNVNHLMMDFNVNNPNSISTGVKLLFAQSINLQSWSCYIDIMATTKANGDFRNDRLPLTTQKIAAAYVNENTYNQNNNNNNGGVPQENNQIIYNTRNNLIIDRVLEISLGLSHSEFLPDETPRVLIYFNTTLINKNPSSYPALYFRTPLKFTSIPGLHGASCRLSDQNIETRILPFEQVELTSSLSTYVIPFERYFDTARIPLTYLRCEFPYIRAATFGSLENNESTFTMGTGLTFTSASFNIPNIPKHDFLRYNEFIKYDNTIKHPITGETAASEAILNGTVTAYQYMQHTEEDLIISQDDPVLLFNERQYPLLISLENLIRGDTIRFNPHGNTADYFTDGNCINILNSQDYVLRLNLATGGAELSRDLLTRTICAMQIRMVFRPETALSPSHSFYPADCGTDNGSPQYCVHQFIHPVTINEIVKTYHSVIRFVPITFEPINAPLSTIFTINHWTAEFTGVYEGGKVNIVFNNFNSKLTFDTTLTAVYLVNPHGMSTECPLSTTTTVTERLGFDCALTTANAPFYGRTKIIVRFKILNIAPINEWTEEEQNIVINPLTLEKTQFITPFTVKVHQAEHMVSLLDEKTIVDTTQPSLLRIYTPELDLLALNRSKFEHPRLPDLITDIIEDSQQQGEQPQRVFEEFIQAVNQGRPSYILDSPSTHELTEALTRLEQQQQQQQAGNEENLSFLTPSNIVPTGVVVEYTLSLFLQPIYWENFVIPLGHVRGMDIDHLGIQYANFTPAVPQIQQLFSTPYYSEVQYHSIDPGTFKFQDIITTRCTNAKFQNHTTLLTLEIFFEYDHRSDDEYGEPIYDENTIYNVMARVIPYQNGLAAFFATSGNAQIWTNENVGRNMLDCTFPLTFLRPDVQLYPPDVDIVAKKNVTDTFTKLSTRVKVQPRPGYHLQYRELDTDTNQYDIIKDVEIYGIHYFYPFAPSYPAQPLINVTTTTTTTDNNNNEQEQTTTARRYTNNTNYAIYNDLSVRVDNNALIVGSHGILNISIHQPQIKTGDVFLIEFIPSDLDQDELMSYEQYQKQYQFTGGDTFDDHIIFGNEMINVTALAQQSYKLSTPSSVVSWMGSSGFQSAAEQALTGPSYAAPCYNTFYPQPSTVKQTTVHKDYPYQFTEQVGSFVAIDRSSFVDSPGLPSDLFKLTIDITPRQGHSFLFSQFQCTAQILAVNPHPFDGKIKATYMTKLQYEALVKDMATLSKRTNDPLKPIQQPTTSSSLPGTKKYREEDKELMTLYQKYNLFNQTVGSIDYYLKAGFDLTMDIAQEDLEKPSHITKVKILLSAQPARDDVFITFNLTNIKFKTFYNCLEVSSTTIVGLYEEKARGEFLYDFYSTIPEYHELHQDILRMYVPWVDQGTRTIECWFQTGDSIHPDYIPLDNQTRMMQYYNDPTTRPALPVDINVYRLLSQSYIAKHPYLTNKEKLGLSRFFAPRDVQDLKVIPYYQLTPLHTKTLHYQTLYQRPEFGTILRWNVPDRGVDFIQLQKYRQAQEAKDQNKNNNPTQNNKKDKKGDDHDDDHEPHVHKFHRFATTRTYLDSVELSTFKNAVRDFIAIHLGGGLFHAMGDNELSIVSQTPISTEDGLTKTLALLLLLHPTSKLSPNQGTPLCGIGSKDAYKWAELFEEKTGIAVFAEDLTWLDRITELTALNNIPTRNAVVKEAVVLQPLVSSSPYFPECATTFGGRCTPAPAGPCWRHDQCQSGFCVAPEWAHPLFTEDIINDIDDNTGKMVIVDIDENNQKGLSNFHIQKNKKHKKLDQKYLDSIRLEGLQQVQWGITTSIGQCASTEEVRYMQRHAVPFYMRDGYEFLQIYQRWKLQQQQQQEQIKTNNKNQQNTVVVNTKTNKFGYSQGHHNLTSIVVNNPRHSDEQYLKYILFDVVKPNQHIYEDDIVEHEEEDSNDTTNNKTKTKTHTNEQKVSSLVKPNTITSASSSNYYKMDMSILSILVCAIFTVFVLF